MFRSILTTTHHDSGDARATDLHTSPHFTAAESGRPLHLASARGRHFMKSPSPLLGPVSRSPGRNRTCAFHEHSGGAGRLPGLGAHCHSFTTKIHEIAGAIELRESPRRRGIPLDRRSALVDNPVTRSVIWAFMRPMRGDDV